MICKKVITVAGKITEVDGLPVLYTMRVDYDELNLASRVAFELQMPSEIAILKNDSALPPITTIVRYGNEWRYSSRYDTFLIFHLFRNYILKADDFQHSY